jgi:ribonuclease Y
VGIYLLWGRYRIRKAHTEAQALLDDAHSEAELIDLELKEREQELREKIWARDQSWIESIEEKLENLTEETQGLEEKWNAQKKNQLDLLNGVKSQIENLETRMNQQNQRLNDKEKMIRQSTEELMVKLEKSFAFDAKEFLKKIQTQLIEQEESRKSAFVLQTEEWARSESEYLAKAALDRALARFQRPYCAEKGIPTVHIENPEKRKLFTPEILKLICELSGCDILLADDMEFFGVSGFDPVRRELAHRMLDRCVRDRTLPPERVRHHYELCRKELFQQIKSDGQNLIKELGLKNFHPEVVSMMGCLRYRYSFTQNQYFHCAEVGWLCGLLAAELGLTSSPVDEGGFDILVARRAGLLHDLGKAMDHELDGGHAVIGAKFIEERGEDSIVVHAVRAHHYDVEPIRPLDYLVIGADAISGARPGARRSTMESYSQKLIALDGIARSFDGVTDCFVLNGGRECRVLVDSQKISDQESLKLSQEIAKKIEEECNYPGQIKIVVIRETIAAYSTGKS